MCGCVLVRAALWWRSGARLHMRAQLAARLHACTTFVARRRRGEVGVPPGSRPYSHTRHGVRGQRGEEAAGVSDRAMTHWHWEGARACGTAFTPAQMRVGCAIMLTALGGST